MDHLDVAAIADRLGIPVETVRSYGERFALFVPAVRSGAHVHYLPEGLQLLGEIDQAVQAGATDEEIEEALQKHIPVTYVASRPPVDEDPPGFLATEELVAQLDGQRDAVIQQLTALRTAMERLTTTDQFHTLRAETASLAAALAQRDAHVQHAVAVVAAELREALSALRRDIADLHAEVHVERRQLADLAAITETEAIPTDPAPGRSPADRSSSSERRSAHRTPRRMGQPLRVNGLPQN